MAARMAVRWRVARFIQLILAYFDFANSFSIMKLIALFHSSRWLLLSSMLARLSGVAVMLAVLWAGVLWALRDAVG
jgi:hypothetical protein